MITDRITALAHAASLLVVTDFDGTLAPLDPDPQAVVAHPGALDALHTLAAQPATEVVVLSGRHLDGLRAVCLLRDPVVLVGSHGAEPSDGAVVLDDDSLAYLNHIEAELETIAAAEPLAYVEVKPYQRVLHVAALAQQDPARADELLTRARQLDTGGRPVTPGSNIVEFSAVDVTKGDWVARRKRGVDATVFVGDDVTDESVFPVLSGQDLGVKVGSGPTGADHTVADVDAVAAFFVSLAAARQQFFRG